MYTLKNQRHSQLSTSNKSSNSSLLQSEECCKCLCLSNDTLDAISKVSPCRRLSGCRHEVQPSSPFTNSAKEIVPAATKQFVHWVNFRRYFCSAFIVHACPCQYILSSVQVGQRPISPEKSVSRLRKRSSSDSVCRVRSLSRKLCSAWRRYTTAVCH